MSRPCDVILLSTATAWPSGARPGDVLVGQAGAIDGLVAIVNDVGTAVPVPVGSSFVPTNDNLTDLGDSTHRFRSLFLGTSVTNAGDLVVDLTGGATRTLSVRNSTAGQVCNVVVDGTVALQGGTAFAVTLTGSPTAARTLTAQDASGTLALFDGAGALSMLANNTNDVGTSAVAARNVYVATSIRNPDGSLTVDCQHAAAATLTLENTGGGSFTVQVTGDVLATGALEAGGVARLSSPGAMTALLNGGEGAGLRVTDVASSVNGVNVATATTGSGVALSAYGTDSEVGLTVAPKGGGVASTLTLGLANQKVLVGGASGSLVGFYGSTARVQGSAVTAPVGGVTVDTECRAAVGALIARLNVSTGVGLILG